MAVKITKHNPHHTSLRTFGNEYAPIQLSYRIIDGLYHNTVFNKIVRKMIANVVPSYFTLTVEDSQENRLPELEEVCKELSSILNRELYVEAYKSYFLYGTGILYDGNRDEDDTPKEIITLHPKDVYVETHTQGAKKGQIKLWKYNYGGDDVPIKPEYIKVFANDPDIGGIFGYSILDPMLDTLHQFLNNRLDLAEILNRYAIPIVQWAVDVEDLADESMQDNLVNRARQMLEAQLDAGEDIVSDARIEPRTLSFANDVGHLISILKESRRDLGMLSIPESLMGGEISNLSGGKTQAAVFMKEVSDYRAELNDFLARNYYIPFLEKKGYIKGIDYHNVYLSFPPTTTELPSESIIWVDTSLNDGLITPNEGRAMLGFRGAAPGTPKIPAKNIGWIEKALMMGLISQDEAREALGYEGPAPGLTDEVKEIFGIGQQNQQDQFGWGQKEVDNGPETKAKNNKKVKEPKNRDGRQPKEDKK